MEAGSFDDVRLDGCGGMSLFREPGPPLPGSARLSPAHAASSITVQDPASWTRGLERQGALTASRRDLEALCSGYASEGIWCLSVPGV